MIFKHKIATEQNEQKVKGQPRIKHLQNLTSKYGTTFTVDQIKFPLSNAVGYRVTSPTGIVYTASSIKEMKQFINRGDKTVVEGAQTSVDK